MEFSSIITLIFFHTQIFLHTGHRIQDTWYTPLIGASAPRAWPKNILKYKLAWVHYIWFFELKISSWRHLLGNSLGLFLVILNPYLVKSSNNQFHGSSRLKLKSVSFPLFVGRGKKFIILTFTITFVSVVELKSLK